MIYDDCLLYIPDLHKDHTHDILHIGAILTFPMSFLEKSKKKTPSHHMGYPSILGILMKFWRNFWMPKDQSIDRSFLCFCQSLGSSSHIEGFQTIPRWNHQTRNPGFKAIGFPLMFFSRIKDIWTTWKLWRKYVEHTGRYCISGTGISFVQSHQFPSTFQICMSIMSRGTQSFPDAAGLWRKGGKTWFWESLWKSCQITYQTSTLKMPHH